MSATGRYRRFAVEGPRGAGEWLLFLLLLPLSVIYDGITRLRALAYRRGWLPVVRLPVPVVSVGNLTAGGTGKTPMTGWLLSWCAANDLKAAVISRGYGGRRSVEPLTVCAGKGPMVGPEEAGDEPFLLARRHPDAIVVVGADRVRAGRMAIEEHGAQILLLDDGYQHLRLARDLNILLADAGRPFGNGRVLPAGYLREGRQAAGRADLLILTRADVAGRQEPVLDLDLPVIRTGHRLSQRVVPLRGTSLAVDRLRGRKGVAFCGIADPEAFFAQLRDLGLTLRETVAFPDHHTYPPQSLQALNRLGEDGDYFITTEKDAVKLSADSLVRPCYRIGLDIVFLQGRDILEQKLKVIRERIRKPMAVPKDLLDILACPQCKGKVRFDEDNAEIICESCRLAYPVRDEIPVMLIDEARTI
ncbi:lipid-A-disaccharide kinase [Geothermobacter ehrlichii]|uniref:Multifunctional fusion protein n=1 Tax=Geothermobacter ehrlichii TaxID=213224 RepID=A0A5D3WLL7_9BACT|nr:tetraacyldisaccharide 4'-kinase [Geothermobacter ehrlichii]TYP00046.1 lipid-A-disaccharide kinase [Geothermobacter ehrlichii]